jgi:hypothetical protein
MPALAARRSCHRAKTFSVPSADRFFVTLPQTTGLSFSDTIKHSTNQLTIQDHESIFIHMVEQ